MSHVAVRNMAGIDFLRSPAIFNSLHHLQPPTPRTPTPCTPVVGAVNVWLTCSGRKGCTVHISSLTPLPVGGLMPQMSQCHMSHVTCHCGPPSFSSSSSSFHGLPFSSSFPSSPLPPSSSSFPPPSCLLCLCACGLLCHISVSQAYL
jgi:hypothetical protein